MKKYLNEIICYFRDFLETDFKKGRLPKRRIESIKKKKGEIIRTCVNCESYDGLFTDLFNFLKSIFLGDLKNKDSSEVYEGKSDFLMSPAIESRDKLKLMIDTMQEQMKEQINKILYDEGSDCLKISAMKYQFKNAKIDLIIDKINEFRFEFENDKKEKLSEILANLKKLKISLEEEDDFRKKIDNNFKKTIDDFILNNLCVELFDIVKDIDVSYFEKKNDLLRNIAFEYIVDCVSENQDFNKKQFIKKYLEFFKAEKINFFMLVRDMYKYENVLYNDNGEFYIYLYDITFNNISFPLFYIPVSIVFTPSMKNILLRTGDKIFLNKKAISYVFKSVNKNCSFVKKRFFDLASDSIKEINDIFYKILLEFNQKELASKISFLDSDNTWNHSFNVGDFVLKIDNYIHFALFDKSDEFIVNDYEEILESKKLQDDFKDIIDNYLSTDKNEKDIINLVEKDFEKLSPSKKIFYNSPVNLSSEQQKILMALNRKDTKTLIVEGPPGTGKSHTIVSIIANYILNNKSVLVLSDKNEALEVIEEKLNDIINYTKSDKNIYNPILRLGLKNNFHNIIKKSNIELIKDEIYNFDYGYCDIKSKLPLFLRDYEKYLVSIGDFRKNQISYNILSLKILQNDLQLKKIDNKTAYNDLSSIILRENFVKYLNVIKGRISEYADKINDYIKEKNSNIIRILNSKNGVLSKLKNEIQNNYNDFDEVKNTYNKGYIVEITLKKDNILHQKQDFKELFNNFHDKAVKTLEKLEKIFNNINLFFTENKKLLDIFIDVNNNLSKNYELYGKFLKNISAIKQLYDFDNNKFIKNILSKIDLEIYKKLLDFVSFYYDLSFFDKLFRKRKEIKKYNKYFFEKLNINKISKHFNQANKVKIFIEDLTKRLAMTDNIDNKLLFRLINIYEIYGINKLNISEKNINVTENLKNINDLIVDNNFDFQIADIFDIVNIHNVVEKLAILIDKIKAVILINFDEIWKNNIEVVDLDIAKIIQDVNCLNYDYLKLDLDEKYYKNSYNINCIKNIEKLLSSVNKYNISLEKDKILKYAKKISISIKYESDILRKADKILAISSDLVALKNKFYLELKDFDNSENVASKENISKSTTALETKKNTNIDFMKNFKHIKLFNIKEKLETISRRTICHDLLYKAKELYNDLSASGNIRAAKSLLKKKMDTKSLNIFLKNFPCIIASLRDYSNIIPLDKDIFDLVIIDEASQVNIAQAFPTLIRGKKILVLGDRKQFSNIKSSMAAKDVNSEYIAKINLCFENEFKVYNEKFKIFNIKNSVLDFMEDSKPDFSIQLRTHFRGYGELISFSNNYFYNNKLQTLKIRKKTLNEIIKFKFINNPYYDTKNNSKNTNQLEIDFIVKQLEKYKTEYENINKKPTIGIISPFTDQVLLMSKQINNHKDAEVFYNDFKLKLMTFDTCQGEERDVIFYSMVATKENDKLSYIFPTDIRTLNRFDDEDSSLRAQRLNVGFSRVKELAYFVLSKNIDQFSGTVRLALEHFYQEMTKNDAMLETTDKKSPMEEKIKNYILATEFYKNNKYNIFFKAQFPVGEYLKQVDSAYNNPNYVVDFLISIKTKKGHKNIIVEYDGFEYHFKEKANKYNYCLLQKEEDIIRQNTLENYGYIFLRLNKFNLDKDSPIDFINEELYSLFDKDEFLKNEIDFNNKNNNQNNENKIYNAIHLLYNNKIQTDNKKIENNAAVTAKLYDTIKCLTENNEVKNIIIVKENSNPRINIFNENTPYGDLIGTRINDEVEIEKPNGYVEILKVIDILKK